MSNGRVVSTGFLSTRDLENLGTGFRRHFAVPQDDIFAHLLRQLDRIEARPHQDGVSSGPTLTNPDFSPSWRRQTTGTSCSG